MQDVSVAAATMIKVLEPHFAKPFADGPGTKLQRIVPPVERSLIDDADLTRQLRGDTAAALRLQNVESSLDTRRGSVPNEATPPPYARR
jgi:hypothetical protein